MHANPVALKSSEVICVNARFQILTDRLIRIEWAEDSEFEDRASLAVNNRCMPEIQYTAEIVQGKHVIKTDFLQLEYTDDEKPFSKNNLMIRFLSPGEDTVWYPGKKDTKNLLGTTRTLDKVNGAKCQLGAGIISKDGWVLYDDSATITVDESGWIAARKSGNRTDWYFWGYGHDYKAAVHDAALIFGRQSLPPLFVFGYWWSRYWAYTDHEIEGLVHSFNERNLPMDVMVIDMDWHLPGWTGYTWDKRFFPDPTEFMGWLKSQGIKITLNLHPADGVARFEEKFGKMAEVLGHETHLTDKIPFDCTDRNFMDAYFEYLHHPHEREGVDFWWLDWQQGNKTAVEGLDPLPWLNRLHWEDMQKTDSVRRPLIFSRFGGIGSGRYPVGFSGDTYSTWESLAFQPYFTATAANVLYGYWSHDIGGHLMGDIEPELYMRWIQYGVFSPILRTHTTKNEKAERRIWAYPEPYASHMASALRLRYELIPYIYTECRKTYDTGISLCRPLYYEWPECEEAYEYDEQYFFGSEIIVSPVVTPAVDEFAAKEIWIPEGLWVDVAAGQMLLGPMLLKRKYMHHEIPLFVKAGSVIPCQKECNRLKEAVYENLVVEIFAGGNGSYDLYEDDGQTTAYEQGKYSKIKIEHTESGILRRICIQAESENRKPHRNMEVNIHVTMPPEEVKINGEKVAFSYRRHGLCWAYDGFEGKTVIRIPDCDINAGTEIEIIAREHCFDRASGLKGLMSRLERLRVLATYAMNNHPDERIIIESDQTGSRISRNPTLFSPEIACLSENMKKIPDILKEMQGGHGNFSEKRQYLKKAALFYEEALTNFKGVFGF